MKPLIGTAAWLLGEAWFGIVAGIDRVLAWCPRRWER